MNNILATSTKVAAVLTPSSVLVADVAAKVGGTPLTVEGVAVSFAGLVACALTATVAQTYVATREIRKDLKHAVEHFARVASMVQGHETKLAEMHENIRVQQTKCDLLHPDADREYPHD